MSNWSEVLITYDEIEASIVKDILESDNIEVVIDSLKITPYPVNIGRMGEVRVMVKNTDLKRAQALLKSYTQDKKNEINEN